MFWNAYKRIENEVLNLSESIHFDDAQLSVYSSRIADLLVRTVIEIESLSKELYLINGGSYHEGKELYYDTDCIKYLEDIWKISHKTVFVSTPYFYFENEENKVIQPLRKAFKRGSSSSKWQQAYQAVKHNRIKNLKKGNLCNLIHALGALFILNVYYRDTQFSPVADKDASNSDWGLGSDLFTVKICPESSNVSVKSIYVPKKEYEECIYLVKHTDETAQAFIDEMNRIDKQAQAKTTKEVIRILNDELKEGKLDLSVGSLADRMRVIQNKQYRNAIQDIAHENGQTILKVFQSLVFEAVLNKQQY